jgi:tRNA(Ile)-lysidine synthetase-like protein
MRGVPHSSVSLPDNNMARIEENCLIFEQDHIDNESEPFFLPFYEGTHILKNGIIIQIEKNPTGKADSSYESIDIACDAIATGAYFRSKEDGDVILTNKLHKKVKKLFNEKGVRLFLRKNLPILVSFDEILWIPTVAACDSIKKGKIKDGEDFFRITVIFENN